MVTDEVQSFNFDNGNGLHLANQNQAICVRRERAYCRICWYTMNNADFELSGSNAVTSQKTTASEKKSFPFFLFFFLLPWHSNITYVPT